MTDLAITMKDINCLYDKKLALSVEHLSIKKGITSVFLGSNGSGKTTLLKLLSGLLTPSQGSINHSIQELKSKAIMVHQTPYLFSGTVFYNIDFVLKNQKVPRKKRLEIIKEVLHQANLSHLKQRKTSQLSGGEKHRLAIARAIAVKPQTLILDEPFAHIDVESRKVVEELISQRSKTGKTTILSTHDLTSAYRLADKMIYLENGEIIESEFNFIKGAVTTRDDYFSSFFSQSENGNITILTPVSDKEHKAVVIPYRDIFLTKNKIKSSAQNQFAGKIISLKKSGSHCLITIDCGVELKAVITTMSVKELELKENITIYLNFKASAVRLY